MNSGELQDVKFFVFTYNMVFESVYCKGAPRTPLLFEIVLRLHQVQMRGDLIFYVVHIVGTRMIEVGINELSRENNLGGMMRGVNSLKYVSLDEGSVVRSLEL